MNTGSLVLSVVSFLVGFLAGYVVKSLVDKKGYGNDMKTLVLLVVSCAWFASVIVELLNPAYHTNPMVHGLMGSIVGFFYKFDITKKGDKK